MGALVSVVGFLKKHPELCLFIVLFVLFNANARANASVDTIPASLLPFSVLDNHDLYFDQFVDYFCHIWAPPISFLTEYGDHYLSIYPIVTPILLIPLYFIPYVSMKLFYIPIDLYDPTFRLIVMGMEKMSASFISALAGVLIYLALKRLVDGKIALIGTLIFGLATSMWSISSQALWQHGMSVLLLSAMIFIVVSGGQKGPDRFRVAALGVLSALFFFNRSSDSFLLLPIVLYILMLKDRRILAYLAAVIIAALPFLAYNIYFFGNPVGGFGRMSSMLSLAGLPMGVAGLLLSPNRGLLIFSPVVLLAIPGYLKIRDLSNRRLVWFFSVAGLSILLTILLYGSFADWHGGGCFGTRYLTDIMPYMAIFIGLFLNGYSDLKKTGYRKWLAILIIILLVGYSVFIQFVGAFCYPNGGFKWDQDHVPQGDEKYWYWHDTQIGRSLQAGFWNPLNVLDYLQNKVIGGA